MTYRDTSCRFRRIIAVRFTRRSDERSEPGSHSFVFPWIWCMYGARIMRRLTLRTNRVRVLVPDWLPRNTTCHLPTLTDQLFVLSSSLADSRNSHDTLGRAWAAVAQTNTANLDLPVMNHAPVGLRFSIIRSFDRAEPLNRAEEMLEWMLSRLAHLALIANSLINGSYWSLEKQKLL